MKIAIFGDSFGDDHINWKDQNRWLDVGPSWVDYLRQYHEVDNYCLGGSSLYYSKRKFDKTDLSKYDKVIFLITNSARRFQIWPGDTIEHGSNWNFANVDFWLEKKIAPHLNNHLRAMGLFFKYVYNESDEHFHDLMIESIKRRCPNDFIIDAQPGSVLGQVGATEIAHFADTTLLDIFKKGFQDARKCHMSEENNLILGQYMHQCLISNIFPNLNKNIFIKPSRPFEHYFRKM